MENDMTKIRITTDRLPHHPPQGTVYEEEDEMAARLVEMGLAEFVKEETGKPRRG
jgi:hypothetical protein